MTHQQFLHYHEGNHFVRCPKCRHYIVRTDTKRAYSNNKIVQQYACLNCGCKFICCAKHPDKIRTINYRIRKYKEEIKKLEKRLMEKSY